MNTAKRPSRAVRWGMALFLIVTVVAIGLVAKRLAPSRAGTPRPQARLEPQQGRRDFIGLPDVNTVSVQSILPVTENITVTFALANGTIVSTVIDTLPAESVRIYTEPEDFSGQGRVEAEADVPYPGDGLRIFGVNFELSESGNDAYLGLGWVEQAFLAGHQLTYDNYLPLAVKEGYQGWTTRFTVQNRTWGDATYVVNFFDQTGFTIHNEVGIVRANGSVSFDLADITEIPDGYIGSILIPSDMPISVASTRMYNSGLGLRSAYPGISAEHASVTLVAPALFKESDSQTSELCVQNVGTVDAFVNVAYTDGVINAATMTPYASHCFDQGAEAHAPGWAGGALVTSYEPLAAIVNVTAYDDDTPVGRWSYSVPYQHRLASGAVALPLLFNDFQSWTSAVHLYNLTDSQAVITPRYVSYPEGFVYCAQPITISARSVITIPQSELPHSFDIATGYLRSTQPVAAVVSATSSKHLGDTDRHFGYEASYLGSQIEPQNPCDTIREVFLPIVLK